MLEEQQDFCKSNFKGEKEEGCLQGIKEMFKIAAQSGLRKH